MKFYSQFAKAHFTMNLLTVDSLKLFESETSTILIGVLVVLTSLENTLSKIVSNSTSYPCKSCTLKATDK